MAGSRPENAASRISKRHSTTFGWLTRRRDFLNAAKGARAHHSAFVLQMAQNSAGNPDTKGAARFGLTVSKQNGNAVKRNRIKRRLRAALSEACGNTTAAGQRDVSQPRMAVRDGNDYVIVARPSALNAQFTGLVAGLKQAAEKVHNARRKNNGNSKKSAQPDIRPHNRDNKIRTV